MDAEGPEFRFAQFALDTRRRELRAGRAVVPLQPRAFDILEHLIRHRNRAVPRDEILHEIYRDRTVSASNVAVQIAAIRTALTRAGGEAKLIVTLTGPAYRFTGGIVGDAGAPPAPAPSLAPPPARRKRWLLPAVALPAVAIAIGTAVLLWPHREAAARLSFAVLPFRNITGDATQDFRAAAITDELNADLAYIPAATVIARESAVAYQEKHLPIPEIGRALHVQYIVTGDLGLEDNAWRAHPRLIDAASGAEVWSETLSFPKSQEGELTPTIAAAIASSLNTTIDQLEASRAHRDRPENPDAIDLLYQSRALLDADDGLETGTRAEALLTEALRLEPDMPDALASLGRILAHRLQIDPAPTNGATLARADQATARALDLAPKNTAALAAHAAVLEVEEKCPAAEFFAAEALKISYSNLDAQMTLRNCAWEQGQLGVALDHIAALERLDPANAARPNRQIMKAHILLLTGRAAEAASLLQAVVDDFPLPSAAGSNPLQRGIYARVLLCAALAQSGRLPEARALYAALAPAIPNVSAWRVFVSYESKSISRLPGTGALLHVLSSVGMPEFADEDAPSGAGCVADGNDFDPTPKAAPGVNLVPTSAVPRLLQERKPVIIDVGSGAAAIPGALWIGAGISTTADVIAAVDAVAARAHAPFLVMGDGPFGCAAYFAARHLAARAPGAVFWYRGGEEAWFRTGAPADDHRAY